MNLNEKQIRELEELAITARGLILTATTISASGHPGGSMSMIDILLTLYAAAKVNPDNWDSEQRDNIIISNGHISPGVYAALSLNGFFPTADFVSQFRLGGSIYEGHIERDVPGVEWGTGNLGQGLSAGTGFALSAKIKNIDKQVYVIMGDGEQQKGQLSEARRFAVKYRLHNLTAIIDYNRLQIGGDIGKIMPQGIVDNYLSDGWQVIEIDGHNVSEINSALISAKSIDAPVMILAHTVMGKGVSFMENKEKYHGSTINEEQLTIALQELGLENEIDKYKRMRESFVPSSKSNKDYSTKFTFQKGVNRLYEKSLDNRSAWGNAISDLASVNKRSPYTPIAVFDCDLQGSVKTKEFEDALPDNFFQCGIMEHHTATLAGALSINNIQVFFADFGVFGVDETYNQHRLNDINHSNLKMIVTHVGLDVGEDGRTHQCIDYVGAFRNFYHYKVIVPLCPNQTDRAIRFLINKDGNYLVAMGRSKVPVIRKTDGTIFYDNNYSFEYGKADLLRDGQDGALFTMGTLAAKAVEIVDNLHAKGISLQLWGIASPMDISDDVIKKAAATGKLFSYEDHNIHTGLGAILADRIMELNLNTQLKKFGVTDYCCSGTAEDVYRLAGLSADTVQRTIEYLIKEWS